MLSARGLDNRLPAEEEEKEKKEENTRDRSVPDGSDKNSPFSIKTQIPKIGFYKKNLIFGNNRDPCVHPQNGGNRGIVAIGGSKLSLWPKMGPLTMPPNTLELMDSLIH